MIATIFDRWGAPDSHFCLLLTYGLVHFVWQGCLLALGFALVRRWLAGSPASVRYAAGVVTLLLMAACLPATIALVDPATDDGQLDVAQPVAVQAAPQPASDSALSGLAYSQSARDPEGAGDPAEPAATPSVLAPPIAAAAPTGDALGAPLKIWDRARHWGNLALAWSSIYATAAYTIGLTLMLLRLSAGLWLGRELRRESIAVTDPTMIDFVCRQAGRLALRVAPTIAWCRRVSVPMVIGVVRPMILLPFSLAVGVTDEQLELVLLHELAHIQRYDLAVNLLQRLIEALLFFHPAVWWLSRQISLEREQACDDAVLRAGCQGPAYADTLVRVAELCMASRTAGWLAATGSGHRQLHSRLLRLFDADPPASLRPATPAVAMLVFLGAGAILALAAWRSPASAQVANLPVAETTDSALAQAPAAPADERATDAVVETPPAAEAVRVPGANPAARVLHFPAGAPIGMVATRPTSGDYITTMMERDWRPLAKAQGDVEVPAGCDVRLTVRGPAAGDLSVLDGLAPDDVQFLGLCNRHFDSDSLDHVGRLTGLRLLWAGCTLVSDAGLAHLAGLEHLEVFLIKPDAGTRGVPYLDEATLGALTRLPSLRKIGFHDCTVSAAGMARLVDLPNLAVLRLFHASVELGGIEALADAPALRQLEIWLERQAVLRTALPQIGKLHGLKELFLSGTPTSADLAHLVGLYHLESLTLEAPVDNLGAFYLAQLPALKTLTISDSRITDAGLGQLGRLQQLERLSIGGFFTDQGIGSLAALKSLRQLEAGSPFVTPAAAEVLTANLPTLRQIDVRHVDPLENRPQPASEPTPTPAAGPAEATSAAARGGVLSPKS